MDDRALFELLDNDGEPTRIAAVPNAICNIVASSMHLLELIDEPLRERDPEEPPQVDRAAALHLGDATFREDYRMSRMVFERLYTVIAPHVERTREVRINPRVQLMMTLWVIATPDSFRSVGRKFGVNRASVHFVYVKHIRAINAVAGEYIRWPTQHEMQGIMHRFEQKGPFPRVVGSLDGSNIVIHTPRENKVAYYDRKGQYSIKLQAVCDDSMQFRDIYVGECGSLHDAKVLKRSPLYQLLCEDNALLDDSHIIADAAYGLRKTLMLPYKRANRNELNERQANFNYALSHVRVIIENAFARLKTKWRSLLTLLDVLRIDYAVWHIVAACVLHNFIIREGESFPEADEPEVMRQINCDRQREEDNEQSSSDDDEAGGEERADAEDGFVGNRRGERWEKMQAIRKRNGIAARLPILPRHPRRRHREREAL